MTLEYEQAMSRKVHALDKIVRGTEATPGHGARLHNIEQRVERLEKNEETLKQWDKERLRLWIVVVVSMLTGASSLIVNIMGPG